MSTDNSTGWPVIAGSYQVGDPKAPVAVCTLASDQLYGQLAKLPGVAISGMVYTANLGIERIVRNITTNPSIRFLLVCGRESTLFKPGQSLVAFSENGMNSDRRIVGAAGYEPVLQSISPDQASQFRRQVEVIDWTGEQDVKKIEEQIRGLAARNPGIFKVDGLSPAAGSTASSEEFSSIPPGGQRESLLYDPKGYFVISIDREEGEIVLRHYHADHKPAHIMRGRGATSMLLGLIREGLVSQLSHAGYLGEELGKAQAALHFGLRYDQDRPLRPSEPSSRPETPTIAPSTSQSAMPVGGQAPKMPPIRPPWTLKEFGDADPESKVNITIAVTDMPEKHLLTATFLDPDEAEPFNLFHRTSAEVTVAWSSDSKIIMGTADEVQMGALLRVAGKRSGYNVSAEQIVILTKVARIK